MRQIPVISDIERRFRNVAMLRLGTIFMALAFAVPTLAAPKPTKKARWLKNCADVARKIDGTPEFVAEDFPSSSFGLTHATRPADAHYARWSAAVANEILGMLRNGKSPQELFDRARTARREFARDFEGMSGPDLEGYGGWRRDISKHDYGEDYIGVSTVDLGLNPTRDLPEDHVFPKTFWKEISRIRQRNQLADDAIRLMREENRLSELDRDRLIVDRHYQTLEGEVVKLASTEFTRVIPGAKDSPFLVRTWNAPKPEIEIVLRDVYARLDLALAPGTPEPERVRQLGLAMYGFFNSMPYYRGSAAVGRIVFSAILSERAGAGRGLAAIADVRAIMSSADQFLREFRQGRLTTELTVRR